MPELLEAGGGVVVRDDAPASIADGLAAAFGTPISGDALAELQVRYGIDRLAAELMSLYDTVLTA
jgi:H+/Cl- antiporter ClcA